MCSSFCSPFLHSSSKDVVLGGQRPELRAMSDEGVKNAQAIGGRSGAPPGARCAEQLGNDDRLEAGQYCSYTEGVR